MLGEQGVGDIEDLGLLATLKLADLLYALGEAAARRPAEAARRPAEAARLPLAAKLADARSEDVCDVDSLSGRMATGSRSQAA